MNSIVTLREKNENKRFINCIPKFDIKKLKLPRNCLLVSKSEQEGDNLAQLSLVNDGFLPIFFNCYQTCELYKTDCEDAKTLVSVLLVIEKYCQQEASSNSRYSLIRQDALNEKLELVSFESEKHKSKMILFLELEKQRNIFSPLPIELLEMLRELQDSKQRVMKAVNDLKNSLEEKEKQALLEMSKRF